MDLAVPRPAVLCSCCGALLTLWCALPAGNTHWRTQGEPVSTRVCVRVRARVCVRARACVCAFRRMLNV